MPARLNGDLVSRRKEIFEALRKKRILVQVHYIPVYFHPYYRDLGFRRGLCPIAEDFYEREISLPVFQGMTKEEACFVIKEVKDILGD